MLRTMTHKKEPVIFNSTSDLALTVAPTVTIDRHRMRFNDAATELCKIRRGTRMHLLYFGNYEGDVWSDNEWYFLFNDDKRGLEIRDEQRGSKQSKRSLLVSSSRINGKFLKDAVLRNNSYSVRFSILKSRYEYKGLPLWKIDISRPVAVTKLSREA